MKTNKIFALILVLLVAALFKESLFAQSTQKFETVKVSEGEKKYAASLLLEEADINEIIKILNEYTGAQIEVVKSPSRNEKLCVEFHFNDTKAAKRLVWYGTKATVKTYVTKDFAIITIAISIRNIVMSVIKYLLSFCWYIVG